MKVLIIHAYSADNKGDGLLVEESLRLIKEAFGLDTEVGLVASYPESFAELGCKMYQSRPTTKGFDSDYMKLLFTRAKGYDVIVSVGGGFLRGKNPVELLKTVIVNGPQLLMASHRGQDSVYLPQSIGPFGPLAIRPVRRLLGRMRHVWLRDNRSIAELDLANSRRSPDLAILGMTRRKEHFNAEASVVLTVRYVNGSLPIDVVNLNRILGQVDSYVQSDVGTNSDTQAVQELNPTSILTYSDLLSDNQDSRVVVAVRLHAALMALAAGHYVIHLAYERKGFGAFEDLGLKSYVHNANNFDANQILKQIRDLRSDVDRRVAYNRQIAISTEYSSNIRQYVIESLRDASGIQPFDRVPSARAITSHNNYAINSSRIGIVIPTLGLNDCLDLSLQSIETQSVKPQAIVVVDQSSNDRIQMICRSWQDKLPVMHIRAQRGLSHARNIGLHYLASKADVVGFLDDDCSYGEGSLEKVKIHFATGSRGAMSGKLISPTHRIKFGDRFEKLNKSNVWQKSIEPALFFSMPVLRLVGDFDEQLGIGCDTPWQSGEGTDLLLRVMKEGFSVHYNPECKVYEHDRQRASQLDPAKKSRMYGRGTGYVYRRHYSWPSCMMQIIRPIVGAGLDLAKGDVQSSRKRTQAAIGRWEGANRIVFGPRTNRR